MLDPDVFFVEQFSLQDLLPRGRAIVNYGGKNAEWHPAAAKLLDMPEVIGPTVMDVTPEILSAEILCDLRLRLGGSDLLQTLAQNAHLHWTEYALYYTFAVNQGTILKYHHPEGAAVRRLARLKQAVWYSQQFTPEKVGSLTDPTTREGICAVVQSSAVPDFGQVAAALGIPVAQDLGLLRQRRR